MECQSCEFWEREVSGERGICRRFPPLSYGGWASTTADDWCGEYKGREQTAAPRMGEPDWTRRGT